jgi:hypothetical protein
MPDDTGGWAILTNKPMRPRRARRASLAKVFLLASLGFASSLAQNGDVTPAPPGEAAVTVGVVWMGGPGTTETVFEIMDREARSPVTGTIPRVKKPFRRRMVVPRENPDAPPVSQWPPPEEGAVAPDGMLGASQGIGPLAPQTVGTNFKAISLLAPNESFGYPPDSVGDVGPAQILAMANGRIKVFSKTGTLGGLNVSDLTFFNSVRNGAGVSDPQVRYDRLSGRWFVAEITTSVPNRVMIAVSSGPTITSTSSFTFFFFQHDLVGPTPNTDTGGFADYDSLGVDRFALYIGINVFGIDAQGQINRFVGATGFVVNKASLLAGTLAVTAFRQIALGSGTGLLAPRGVSNDDPAATEGYFVGVDNVTLSRINILRIANPGGTPSSGGAAAITVPTTTSPIAQVAMGSSPGLDGLDDRLFSAMIRKNKITGVSSLWTAHAIEANSSGVGAAGGGRNASRWYEIANLTTTPTLAQAGTLFDPAAASPRGFWMETVAASGQGHMALGSSYASQNDFAGVATAGRLRTDAPGTIRAATLAQVSVSSYNRQTGVPQRWGDYSHTVVDPTDDMTMWTFQEWCDTTNSWGVQVVQLKAPPPAALSSVFPSSLCAGLSSFNVTLTGTSVAGAEFFDPGPDTGGPGYPNRLAAVVSSGVTVNSVTFTDPTHVTLNLRTIGAATGPRTVTITNPDGQTAASASVLSVGPFPAPAVTSNAPVCAGGSLQLSASGVSGATYSWTGPNGFASSAQNPVISGATTAASGTYTVTYAASGCASTAGTVAVTVIAGGAACSDGNACTTGDTCQAGTCAGSNPVVCPVSDQCHEVRVCNPATGLCSGNTPRPDGTACDDGVACTAGDACRSGLCVSGLEFFPPGGSPAGTGPGPISAALADFNTDGKPDLAVADFYSDQVTILLGDGSGGFAPAAGSPWGAGVGPSALATGDFNRDGRADLAVTGYGSNDVTILLGNGTAGFAPSAGSPVGVGTGPFSVAVADLNLDGKADLAVGNNAGNDVTILLGDGAGGFAAPVGSPVGAGSGPISIAVADFNNDGKPDLAVGNNASYDVTILLGNGTGSFTIPAGSPVGAGAGPFAVAAADFNHDGKPDLVVANNESNDLTILAGDGAGGFVPAAGSPAAAGAGPFAVVVADFNLDGRPDLAVTNGGGDSLTVLLGDGSGGFVQPPGSPFGTGSSPYPVVAGDFNLDGKPDLAAANFGADTLTVFLGAPSGAPDGTVCNDGNACTIADSCLAGSCRGGWLRDDDGDGHAAALCGGDDCNDLVPAVWLAPLEVTNLVLTSAIPTNLSWDDQGALAGPGTTYDLVSGPLVAGAGPNFSARACLQQGGATTYEETRANPIVGYWYLVRGRNPCGLGTYGTSQRDAAIPPCP